MNRGLPCCRTNSGAFTRCMRHSYTISDAARIEWEESKCGFSKLCYPGYHLEGGREYAGEACLSSLYHTARRYTFRYCQAVWSHSGNLARGQCHHQSIPVSTPQILTNYTVQAGDTLWDLARKFGTSVEAITRLNDLDDPSKIYVGQRLRIPF